MHGRQISRRLACLSHARYWAMLEASQITRSRLKATPSSPSSRWTVFPITTMECRAKGRSGGPLPTRRNWVACCKATTRQGGNRAY